MTYNDSVDFIFDYCVQLLIDWAAFLGMSYEEINILIFIILEPIAFIGLLCYTLTLHKRNYELRCVIRDKLLNHECDNRQKSSKEPVGKNLNLSDQSFRIPSASARL